VVGIVKAAGESMSGQSILYVRGDATRPRGDGERLIAHVVHNATPNWGGRGFARNLANRWPSVQADFKAWAAEHDLRAAMGEVRFHKPEPGLTVASMVCQQGYRPLKSRPLIRYAVLRDCLERVAEVASSKRATVHMPRIGTGVAGGRWSIIEELIESTLIARGLTVMTYDLPGAEGPQPEAQLSLLSSATA